MINNQMEYEVRAAEFAVTVRRKKIKNIYLRLKADEGKFFLSIPLWVTRAEAVAFLLSRLGWLRAQTERIQRVSRQQDDEVVWLWGKAIPLITREGKKNFITMAGDEVVIELQDTANISRREALLQTFYRDMLNVEIKRLLDLWQPRLGLFASSWKLRTMKSRWGSCNIVSKNLSFNLLLARRPLCCLEYVVVHELAHLYEASHNARFKAFLDEVLPDWRQRRKLLNDFAFIKRDV